MGVTCIETVHVRLYREAIPRTKMTEILLTVAILIKETEGFLEFSNLLFR